MIKLIKKCTVCGKEFKAPSGVVTCESCRGTVLKDRTFGVKTCVWCGKEFIAKSPRQTSCGDIHYLPCPDCGVLVEVKESYQNFMKNGGKPRRCKDCRAKAISATRMKFSEDKKAAIKEKTIRTCREKYGTDYPMQSDEIQYRAIEGVRTIHGVDNVSQSALIRQKIDKTVQEKYGGYTLASPILRQKVEVTNVRKYGVKFPLQCEEIQEKLKRTNMERYGVKNVLSSPEIQHKIKQTCIERYGSEYAMSNSDIHQRAVQTNIHKYGATMYPISKGYIVNVISDPSKIDNYTEFSQDPRKYIQDHYPDKPTLRELSKDVGITETTMSDVIIRYNCKDLISYFVSSMEQDVANFIRSLGVTNIQMHDRQLISPKEVDIYLPDFSLGIECNPTYTHNSSFATAWSEDRLSYKYHQNKTEACQSAGIQLLHIFGYQWTNKRDIVLSMIRNLLHKNQNRVFARNTEIHDVSSKEANNFLDSNHIQGHTTATVRLGLYHENKLISIMTFSKPRFTSGFKSSYDDNTWELTRFCTCRNTTCVGGASKLFEYFLQRYQPSMVVSFSDRSITRGNLYRVLNFEFDSYVDPGYVWVNMDTDQYYTRVACQKSNLPKLFNESDLDIINQTEAQIMEAHGYARVYNSGLIKWVYTKPVA